MEDLKEILNRIPWVVVGLIIVAFYGYGYYSFKFDEVSSPLAAKKKELDQAKMLNDRLRKKIKDAELFFKSLEVKKEELRSVAVELSQMKNTLTEDIDIAAFVKMVVTEAKRVGIRVLSIRPTKENTAEFYTEQEFDLEFKGLYAQLVILLERLSNSQKIVRVDEFELQPTQKDTDSKYVDLTGKMKIKTYKYNASTADDIASSAESGQYDPKIPAAQPTKRKGRRR